MDLNEIINNVNEYSLNNKTNFYNEKLISFKSQFQPILNEYKKYYVINKMYPNNNEYATYYSNSLSNLNNLKKQVDTLQNELNIDVTKVNDTLLELNKEITLQRKINKKLKLKSGLIENNLNSSQTIFDDFEKIHYLNLLRFSALITCCLIVISLIKQLTNNKYVNLLYLFVFIIILFLFYFNFSKSTKY